MKIAFPRVGSTWVSVKCLLEHLGLQVVLPCYSVEEAIMNLRDDCPGGCYLSDYYLADIKECMSQGAEKYLLPACFKSYRFDFAGQLQAELAAREIDPASLFVLEPSLQGFRQLVHNIKRLIGHIPWFRLMQGLRLAYSKALFLDELERFVQYLRPREYVKGTADKVLAIALQALEQAGKMTDLREAFGLSRQKLLHVPYSERKETLRLGLVNGSIDPFSSFAGLVIERNLGYLGAQVTRACYFSNWLNEHFFNGFLKKLQLNAFYELESWSFHHFESGLPSNEDVARYFRKAGYHGLVRVISSACDNKGCLEEIDSIISEEEGFPVLTVYVNGPAGISALNKCLESFINSLWDKYPKMNYIC